MELKLDVHCKAISIPISYLTHLFEIFWSVEFCEHFHFHSFV